MIFQGPIFPQEKAGRYSFDFDIPLDASVSGIEIEVVSDSMSIEVGRQNSINMEGEISCNSGIFGGEHNNWGLELTPVTVNESFSCGRVNSIPQAKVFYTREEKRPEGIALYLQRHTAEEMIIKDKGPQCGELIMHRMLPIFQNQMLNFSDFNDGLTTIGKEMTLFIHGHSTTSGTPPDVTLHVGGHLTASSTPPAMSLFTIAHETASGIPFNMKILGPTDVTASGQPTLFVNGTPAGTGSIFNTTTLYTQGAIPSGTMNLFLKMDLPTSGGMPLYIQGSSTSIAKTMTLFVANSGINNTITLFVEGKQLTIGNDPQEISSGWIPATGAMVMYIDRQPAEMASMFIQGAITSSGDMTLYVANQLVATSSVSLVMPNIFTTNSDDMNLYIHGRGT